MLPSLPVWMQTMALFLLLPAITSSVYFAHRASRATRIIRHLRRNEARLATLAATDALTGVANRRRFDEMLELEWRRAIRCHAPISMLLIDIDNFKAYNDRYGHLLGDSCLQALAAAISASILRPGDLVARFGGEEFAVILPVTDLPGALEIASRVLDSIDEMALPHSGSQAGRVTASIGVACSHPQRASLASNLVANADTALYRAKRGGRNRIDASTPLPGSEIVVPFPTPARRLAN